MTSQSFFNRLFRIILVLLAAWVLVNFACNLSIEILWFQEVRYLSVFWLQFTTQLTLWITTFGISSLFLLGNLLLSRRLTNKNYPQHRLNNLSYNLFNSRITATSTKPLPKLNFRKFFPIVLTLSIILSSILWYYGKAALRFWYSPDIFIELHKFALTSSKWELGLFLSLSIAILVKPKFILPTISILLSLIFGFLLSEHWANILQFFHPTSFNSIDPLFKTDISFYIFFLPVWQTIKLWLIGLSFYSLIAVALTYLLSDNSLAEGTFSAFSKSQRRHIYANAAVFSAILAVTFWIGRYELLYSTRGVTYGASYTDVTIQLPIYTTLSVISLLLAILLAYEAIFFKTRRSLRLGGVFLILSLTIILAVSILLPSAVQRFVVQPNELAREYPYIQRSIALTRQAFNLDAIDSQTFNPQNNLTTTDLQKNDLTIRNIRLWDTLPLLQSNRQLQQIRPYYKFPDADIDRYTLSSNGTTEKQQTIIAARELDYTAVPQAAQTWVNEHLVYTHGYGFTLSPVNTVAAGGLPDYYVKDIGVDTTGNRGALQIANERIRASIPIGKPRIYYGEISNTYIMTRTKVREFDYPSGDENVYTVYDGRGGINIGASWRRWLFAYYLKDWQMLLTRNFTPQTQLLWRRNIRERVQRIAPFLRYDSEPYLVAADGGGTTIKGEKTYLYWILDAYTISSRYPYSDPGKNQFNYIRNSVKVVVDAYNGAVNFYVADTQDPIITTFAKIFPNLLQPLSAIPAPLRSHLRYPVDLFSSQSQQLLTYHMTDPQVFYNREDQWQIPNEIYGNKPQSVQPYFLITKLPTAQTEEFILLLPFTPTQRPNLIAWLAARSDGDNYGKLLLYEFPKQVLVYGTEQVEALINQDPVISQQISLWNRQGSRLIQGNLLVIPIESSLLYVEPLYLEAEQNSLPTLVRVVVAYNNRIVMAQSLAQALNAIFQPQQPSTPVVRPAE